MDLPTSLPLASPAPQGLQVKSAASPGNVIRLGLQEVCPPPSTAPSRMFFLLLLAYSLGALPCCAQAQQQRPPKPAPVPTQDNMPISRAEQPKNNMPVYKSERHKSTMPIYKPKGQKVYEYVENMPVYKDGGVDGLIKFFRTNFHLTPPPGTRRLFLSFVVGKDGKAYNPVLQPDDANIPESTRQEVMRVFGRLGEFVPGRQSGNPVDVSFTMPLTLD